MKKTILISSGTFLMGGVERALVEYLNLIDLTKYRVILFMDSDLGELNVLEKGVPNEIEVIYLKSKELALKTLAFKRKKRKFLDKVKYERLTAIERKEKKRNFLKEYNKIKKVDIVIDFDFGLSKIIGEVKDVKKMVWVHSYLPELIKNKKKLERNIKNLEQYDKIITVCKEMQDELGKIAPKIKNKMDFIYNPFDIERIIKRANEDSELSDLEKSLIQENYFLSVSRLDLRSKDYKTLIDAYEILKNKGIKEKLYIIGEGSGREEIESMIKSKKLEEYILLLGEKENPYIWMKNAKVFIHSSKFEGFGIVLVEAMVLKKMIVSSDCLVGPKEILSEPKSGLLFRTGNSMELANRVEEILTNKNIEKEISENIEAKSKSFGSEVVMRKFYSIVENVINDDTQTQIEFVYNRRREMPILMYHRVIRSQEEIGHHKTYIEYEKLEKQFKYLKKKGFKTITFKDLSEMSSLSERFKSRNIILTFDDAYEDNYYNLLPLLKKYNFRAVIYVTNLDYNKWDVESSLSEKKFNLMTDDMLTEMNKSGFVEFGGHTMNHPKLAEIEIETAKKEIIENKYRLEEKYGKLYSFSYPYGNTNEKIKKILKEDTDYKYAVGIETGEGRVCINDDLYEIRRINIHPKTSDIFHFSRKVKGNYIFKKEMKKK